MIVCGSCWDIAGKYNNVPFVQWALTSRWCEAVSRGLHTRLGSDNNLAPASILVTVTHWSVVTSIGQCQNNTHWAQLCSQCSSTHFNSGTSTTKSWGTPCLWLFFAIFFTLLCQLVWTWKAQTAAHLKSLCTVHYGRYETMPQHNTVTHPHIDPVAIVAAALFKITFTLNRYIYTIHYVTAESSIVYVCTHRFPFKRSFHIWAKSVIYTRLMQCNDLF